MHPSCMGSSGSMGEVRSNEGENRGGWDLLTDGALHSGDVINEAVVPGPGRTPGVSCQP